MAVDSFECKIITGGYNHCDNKWNKSSDELDRCFKIYHPVSGDALIKVDQKEYRIKAGNYYFISGYKIVSQKCTSFMDIYWLHFVPVSLHLKHILLKTLPIHVWPDSDCSFIHNFDRHISKMFRGDFLSTDTSSLPYSFEEAKLHSNILEVIAEIIRDMPAKELAISGDLKRLSPSVKLMNDEFRNNPSLEEIARKSNLAPNYFHRIFKQTFGTTPYNYMLKLRMEHAVKLLTSTSKTIKEVSFECGYNNEFYFQRQFKQHYSYSPGKLKKMRPF